MYLRDITKEYWGAARLFKGWWIGSLAKTEPSTPADDVFDAFRFFGSCAEYSEELQREHLFVFYFRWELYIEKLIKFYYKC